VCHDGDDMYFVVVVDKGIAMFSDIVNLVVIDYGFWLGDVFVLGGLVGYDYKVMGIIVCGGCRFVSRVCCY